MGRWTKDATKADAGRESLAVPFESPDEPMRHVYFEVPDTVPADWMKYHVRRRLDAVRAVLDVPPVTILWFVDGGNTLREAAGAARAVARLWNCTVSEVFYYYTHAGEDADLDEDGHCLGFTTRSRPSTIWLRAEPWVYAPSERKRSEEHPNTLCDALTHELRHVWQHHHFTCALLNNEAAYEFDAYAYQTLFKHVNTPQIMSDLLGAVNTLHEARQRLGHVRCMERKPAGIAFTTDGLVREAGAATAA